MYLVIRGYFRSRDKDGSHAIRSAITENFMLHANFIEPELLPIHVLHSRNRVFFTFYAPFPSD